MRGGGGWEACKQLMEELRKEQAAWYKELGQEVSSRFQGFQGLSWGLDPVPFCSCVTSDG